VSTRPSSAVTPDFVLLGRLREVIDGQPATESELRTLSERAEAWVRALQAQIESSERRLRVSAANPNTPLAEAIGELRRIDVLHPQLAEIRPLLDRLEKRAHELRAEWVARSG
jgi:hypothetical protein